VVHARLDDRYREMSAATILTAHGACRTPCDVIAAAAFGVREVAENLEDLVSSYIDLRSNRIQFGNPIRNGIHASSQRFKQFPVYPFHLSKQPKLRLKVRFGSLEPVTIHTGAMNAERTTYCIPKLAGLQLILARKHLYAVRCIPFECDTETLCDIQDIMAAQSCR